MTPCTICGTERRSPLFAKDGGQYTRCTGCGWVSLDPAPPEEASRALYTQGYFERGTAGGYVDYVGDEVLHRANARERCRRLAALMPNAPGSLVDVGCAVGFFLDEARRAGWRVRGVEVSAWAADEARRRTGAPVYASLPELLEAGGEPCDAVTFFQVLEHMPHPVEALAHAHACLRPGGAVVIETWDRGSRVARLFGSHWQQVTPPSVLHLFARRDLDAVLDKTGFALCSIHKTSKRVSAGFVAGLLASKYPRATGWLRRAVTGSGLGRFAIRYRLGDLITVVGQKRG